MQEISNKKSNVRVWLTFDHYLITQDRFTIPEATHFWIQNHVKFFIWNTFESLKTGLLFLKRHILGSKMVHNSSFGPLLNPLRQVYYSWSDTFLDPKWSKILHLDPFWILQDRFTIPEATHFWFQNHAKFFIWNPFESPKTGLLFLKRHIFGSKIMQFFILEPFLKHPRQVYYSWSDTFSDPKIKKITFLPLFWTFFESLKSSLLFLKRHNFGSKTESGGHLPKSLSRGPGCETGSNV